MTDNVMPWSTPTAAPEARWFDSFINLLAGLGVTGRDKLQSQQYAFTPLSLAECEMAYRGDWLVRKAVQIPAWDMTREWRKWQADPDQITKLETLERELFLQQKVQQALIKARLYGGAAIIIGVANSGNPEDELNLDLVKQDSLQWLHVVSMNNITIGPVIYDITSKYYGQPEYYEALNTPLSGKDVARYQAQSNPSRNVTNVKLHPSRVVKLIGMDTGDFQLSAVWGDSVLQPINDAIKACGMVNGSLATLVSELKIDVIKIPNLSNILSTDAGTKKVVGRFQAANAAKSVINTIMLDSTEDWQRIQQTLTGVPEVIATYLQMVSGAVDIPAGRFLGLPHRGLNVTGEADFRNYYDRLASEQKVTLTPAMTVLDDVLIRSALGDRPENVIYEWNSLWQLSDGDKADINLKNAQAYQIDVNAGQLPPVALGNARANQLIEQGTYPGLEQALEDCAAEGDTIEEQNQPAPIPTALAANAGVPADPNATPGPQPGKQPALALVRGGGMLPASKSGLPRGGATGDASDYDPNQERDPQGRWGAGGGGGSKAEGGKATSGAGAGDVGIKAVGIEERDKLMQQWQAESPMTTVEAHMASGPGDQEKLTMAAHEAAAAAGTQFENPGVKSQARLEEKLAKSGRAVESVTDVVRGGFKVDDPKQADQIIEHLAKSFPVADEGWQKTPAGYFDRKAMLKMPSGAIAEVQMWHPSMLAAKETGGGHKLYAQWQGQPKGSPAAKELEGKMSKLYGDVAAKLPSSWKGIV